MTKKILSVVLGALALYGMTLISTNVANAAAIIANHECIEDFEFIPEEYLTQIRNDYSFYYGHTSHGSQIMTGLSMLYSEIPITCGLRFTKSPMTSVPWAIPPGSPEPGIISIPIPKSMPSCGRGAGASPAITRPG